MNQGAATTSPGYGALLTVTLTWVAGVAGADTSQETIARVVFNMMNGITHSMHFDERQVIPTCNFAHATGQVQV